jgi:hypothetical protein
MAAFLAADAPSGATRGSICGCCAGGFSAAPTTELAQSISSSGPQFPEAAHINGKQARSATLIFNHAF